jgi:hypothetical protein
MTSSKLNRASLGDGCDCGLEVWSAEMGQRVSGCHTSSGGKWGMLDQIRTVSYCEVVVLGYRDDGQIIYMTVIFCYGVKVGMRFGNMWLGAEW